VSDDRENVREDRSLGERIDGWSKRSLILVIITLVAGLVAAIAILVQTGKGIVRWAEPASDWRPAA
jgi:hypothetical protein